PTVSVISAETTRGTANQAGFAPRGSLRLSLSLMRILRCVIAPSASCSDHQAAQVDVLVDQLRGGDSRAVADQGHSRLELPVHLRILRITATVEADHHAHDPLLQVEAQELAALRSAAEDEAVPAGREADVLDGVLVLIRPAALVDEHAVLD